LRRDALAQGAADERGAALVLALLAIVLLLALGGALIVLTMTETKIAATFRDGVAALYAAEAALDRALVDINAAGDWSAFDPARRIYPPTPLRDLVPGIDDGGVFVDVWVSPGPGPGTQAVQAHARREQVTRTLEAIVARGDGGLRLLSWRELR
jgi:hypothetical protein